MAAMLPRQDSSGCLPKMADISSEDFRRYVQPAILEYNAKARELLRTHHGTASELERSSFTVTVVETKIFYERSLQPVQLRR